MDKAQLKRMFLGTVTVSPPTKESEPQETVNGIGKMAYKLCGTMLVNCKPCDELTIAIRRVQEGVLYFQQALKQAVQEPEER